MAPDGIYMHSHSLALSVAAVRARRTGARHRVQRVTWPAEDWARWYIAPTPAPSRVAVEQCS